MDKRFFLAETEVREKLKKDTSKQTKAEEKRSTLRTSEEDEKR